MPRPATPLTLSRQTKRLQRISRSLQRGLITRIAKLTKREKHNPDKTPNHNLESGVVLEILNTPSLLLLRSYPLRLRLVTRRNHTPIIKRLVLVNIMRHTRITTPVIKPL